LNWFSSNWFNAEFDLFGLQQGCKQESENLDKGRITGSAPPPEKIAPFPEWRTVSRIFISGPWQVCFIQAL